MCHGFFYCDVDLDGVWSGQRPAVAEIERVGIEVPVTVDPIKAKSNSRGLVNFGVQSFEMPQNVLDRCGLKQSEIEILRKSVVVKIATLECRAAFERENCLERRS